MPLEWHSTTICAVQKNGELAMAGDGQVTFGETTIMKKTAKKIRRIYNDKVIIGFAGKVSDAFSLEEKFESKLNEYNGNLLKAAVELTKQWRSKQQLKCNLEAMLIAMNSKEMMLISGNGELIEPDDGILAIGSGGNYAFSAAKAMLKYSKNLSAKEIAENALHIAADICVFTNHNITVEYFKENF